MSEVLLADEVDEMTMLDDDPDYQLWLDSQDCFRLCDADWYHTTDTTLPIDEIFQ